MIPRDPLHHIKMNTSDVELFGCSMLFSSSFQVKSFIFDHVDAELSVIYNVHHPCHGSPYEPYLEDRPR